MDPFPLCSTAWIKSYLGDKAWESGDSGPRGSRDFTQGESASGGRSAYVGRGEVSQQRQNDHSVLGRRERNGRGAGGLARGSGCLKQRLGGPSSAYPQIPKNRRVSKSGRSCMAEFVKAAY